MCELYLPLSQLLHSPSPELEYFPGEQSEQLELPDVLDLPARHLVHSDSPVPDSCPARQGLQSRSPELGPEVPAGQSRQEAVPSSEAYFPISQSVQPGEATFELFPKSQSSQLGAMALLLLPAGHSMQLPAAIKE